jgi:hypothetical protein
MSPGGETDPNDPWRGEMSISLMKETITVLLIY